jgi:hypothetical protein
MKIKVLMMAFVICLLAGAFAGFGLSYQTGIQPGYFEKQEAPAYGVADDKPMGSELGQEYQEYFQKLYEKE